MIWTIIPFVILIGMAYPATRTVLEMKDASNADMSIKVTGYQWKWEYDYQQDGVKFLSNLATPRDQIEERGGKVAAPKNENYLLEVDNPLVVPVGKKVRLLITSNDVIHGWYVPQLGVNQYGIPGFIKDAWFTIEKAGTYRGQCSQICGKEHAFMPIVVVAKEQAELRRVGEGSQGEDAAAARRRRARRGSPGRRRRGAGRSRRPEQEMDDGRAQGAGEKLYAANCSACHQPTGKGMPPAFPALDGSKIATGPKAGHMAVVLKGRPGTAMASFAHLADADLAAIITFERNSWGNKTGDAIQPAEIAAARK